MCKASSSGHDRRRGEVMRDVGEHEEDIERSDKNESIGE